MLSKAAIWCSHDPKKVAVREPLAEPLPQLHVAEGSTEDWLSFTHEKGGKTVNVSIYAARDTGLPSGATIRSSVSHWEVSTVICHADGTPTPQHVRAAGRAGKPILVHGSNQDDVKAVTDMLTRLNAELRTIPIDWFVRLNANPAFNQFSMVRRSLAIMGLPQQLQTQVCTTSWAPFHLPVSSVFVGRTLTITGPKSSLWFLFWHISMTLGG